MSDLPPKKFVPEPFPYHHELELAIEALSNSGDGVARVDGWVVFVPFALPGDRVVARIWKNEKNCSYADLASVVEPSSDRVEPVCRLFGLCGGCQYQHLSYEKQLEWKTQQVADLLRLQAGLTLPVNPAIASPKQYNYRSKITPHFDKPKNQQQGIGPIGFLKVGSRRELVDVPACPIAMECINEALPPVRKTCRENSAQYKRGATLLMRASEGGVLTNNGSIATEYVGNLEFHFLAGDFFQNNPFILPLFTSYVADQASQGGQEFLVDAYCGSGLFSLSLASRFKKVVGVEVSETSADWARSNARTNGIDHASFMAADASAIFADVDYPPHLTSVVIDPPRKGCDMNFLNQLFAFGPARVVYVSCNPATQIRDLAEFDKAGYQVTAVQPFDLFPQTKHLECVVTLVRSHSSNN
jgi:23S rRNA (uracil1939-C5)-methyltransferase/tRNA (uracil-5-)-methyltransferase